MQQNINFCKHEDKILKIIVQNRHLGCSIQRALRSIFGLRRFRFRSTTGGFEHSPSGVQHGRGKLSDVPVLFVVSSLIVVGLAGLWHTLHKLSSASPHVKVKIISISTMINSNIVITDIPVYRPDTFPISALNCSS